MKAFLGKFSSISRDLEIFTVPRLVGRVKRSLLVLIPKAFRAKSVHNLIGHDIPVAISLVGRNGPRPLVVQTSVRPEILNFNNIQLPRDLMKFSSVTPLRYVYNCGPYD